MARFIVIEGGEGVGKSTLAAGLQRVMKDAEFFREPGSTELGESIRNNILAKLSSPDEIDPWSMVFLFAAARAELVAKKIRPALDDCVDVVLDRFIFSSMAYQSAPNAKKTRVSHTDILAAQASMLVRNDVWPTHVIYLKANDGVGMRRAKARNSESLDAFEDEHSSLHRHVGSTYEKIFNSLSFSNLEAITRHHIGSPVPRTLTVDTTHKTPEEVLNVVCDWLGVHRSQDSET